MTQATGAAVEAPSHVVQVGLLGMGVVGAGVARVLTERAAAVSSHTGGAVRLHKVLVRDAAKARGVALPEGTVTTQSASVLDDPAISVIIELMGGDEPAHSYIRRALAAGKHVITANKEVIARHGPDLMALAREHGVVLRYEAAVGGGIPLIVPFHESLPANEIASVRAIINGTTNYILTRMSREGLDLAEALASAQELGYAEADPTNDIEGIDAAYKLSILASLAFHTRVAPDAVYREGITKLTARDFRYAAELGYAIKLLAIGKRNGGSIEARVHPAFVPLDRILAKVDGVFNAVEVEGDLTGEVMFYGRGAGERPTTSAVVADVIELVRAISSGVAGREQPPLRSDMPVLPMEAVRTRYYVRMTVTDKPGVLAGIAGVLGEAHISIASVVQKEVDERAGTAEIVLMTHLAQEAGMRSALAGLASVPGVGEIGSMVRVEG